MKHYTVTVVNMAIKKILKINLDTDLIIYSNIRYPFKY